MGFKVTLNPYFSSQDVSPFSSNRSFEISEATKLIKGNDSAQPFSKTSNDLAKKSSKSAGVESFLVIEIPRMNLPSVVPK
jgi:hypothetical protein